MTGEGKALKLINTHFELFRVVLAHQSSKNMNIKSALSFSDGDSDMGVPKWDRMGKNIKCFLEIN